MVCFLDVRFFEWLYGLVGCLLGCFLLGLFIGSYYFL